MFGRISSLFAKSVILKRIGSLVEYTEPEKRVILSREPYQFIPGEWYRTVGRVYLSGHKTEYAEHKTTVSDRHGQLNDIVIRFPAARTLSRVIVLRKKTDVLLVEVIPYDLQFLPDEYVRLLHLVFLVESTKFSYTFTSQWIYPTWSALEKAGNNYEDLVYSSFRPSKFYPNFRRVMLEDGHRGKRAGVNLAGIDGQIKL
jgi:hypothetical protein